MLASIPLQIPTALAFVCFIYNPIFFFFLKNIMHVVHEQKLKNTEQNS